MPFYPSTIFPSSPNVLPSSPGLSPSRARAPPRSTSLTPRALSRLQHRPPNIAVVPDPGGLIPAYSDQGPAVTAVSDWKKDDAVEVWRRRVAAAERRKTQLMIIGDEGAAEEAAAELGRLMDEAMSSGDFDLGDLQLPLDSAEKREHELTRRLRLSEQRFAFPPRQVGHSLAGPVPSAQEKAPSAHTLDITMEKSGLSAWGLRKKARARAGTLQVETALPVAAVRVRSATLQVPSAYSPDLATSELSGTYSLTPIDIFATPSKATTLLGILPAPPSATVATAGRLEQPRPPFARHRVDSNASTGSSAASYFSNCFPSRPSISSSRTKTSGTQAGHGRSDSAQKLSTGAPNARHVDSPLPFQGLLPCFRESASLPDLHAEQMRELLTSPTPPPRPPRHPARPRSKTLGPSPDATRVRKPSPLSGLARKLSLTRAKPTSTTDLKRKQSAKRGLFGMPLRSASQTDLLEAESPVGGSWAVRNVYSSVGGDNGYSFPMPPGVGVTKAERRLTREVWEAESERLRLRLSGVGGSAES